MNSRISYLLCLLLLFSCGQTESTSHVSTDSVPPSESPAPAAYPIKSTFKWHTETCEHTGEYDASKFTDKQLKNTWELWFNQVTLETSATVFKPEELPSLSMEKLNAEYNQKKKHFTEVELIPGEYWETLRKNKLHEIEDGYELRKITLQAFKNPAMLKNNRFTADCSNYADALASNDTAVLYDAWDKFVQEQKEFNGNPDEFMRQYRIRSTSGQKKLYATIDLITFGWWNCANKKIRYMNRDETMENEFKKLFGSLKSECDEP